MKVINFIAGPGAGKSTIAAGLFHIMKRAGDNVELVSEYAKDMTWEGRSNILQDQLYMLAKQNRRLSRLEGKVDYAITDSPLILCAAYAAPIYYDNFVPLVVDVFNTYDNVTYYIERSKPYQAIGRNQTLEEAISLDHKIADHCSALGVKWARISYDIDLQKLRSISIGDWNEVAKNSEETCPLR